MPHDEIPEAVVISDAPEPAIVNEHEANEPVYDLAVDFNTAKKLEDVSTFSGIQMPVNQNATLIRAQIQTQRQILKNLTICL